MVGSAMKEERKKGLEMRGLDPAGGSVARLPLCRVEARDEQVEDFAARADRADAGDDLDEGLDGTTGGNG